MELKLVLDFDGVLFNSAFEAYTVCHHAVADLPHYRQEVGFEEFMEFRAVVTDAWQYNCLFDEQRLTTPDALYEISPDDNDWAFSRRFFAARSEMMLDPSWPKLMAPYDFFFLLRPLLLANPDCFAILSTRNVDSIRRTLSFYDADVVEVFGQEHIRASGSKVAVAEAQGWLTRGKYLVVYVDDMNAHLEPFEGRVHLPLHADWGYDHSDNNSLTQHHVLNILSSMLKLTRGTQA